MNRGQNSVNNNKQCQDSKIVKSVSASLDIGIKKKKKPLVLSPNSFPAICED